MKTITILSILLFSSLHASSPTCKTENYLNIDFQKIQNFEKFNLTWAICEKGRGNIEAAMSAYERVLLINPDNTEASIALLNIYTELSMLKDKQELLRSLENQRLTPEQRRIVATLENEDDSLSFRSSILLNAGYDSNVNFLPSSNIVNDEGIKDSVISNIMVDVNIKHELDEKGGFSLLAKLNILQQSVYMAHEFDLLYANIEAGAGYDIGNLSISIPLAYANVYYLQRNLVNQYGIKPNASLLISENNIVNLGFKYLESNYVDIADQNRDAAIINTSAAYFYLFGKNFAYIEAEYENYSAQNITPLVFTDRSYLYFKAGASYALTSYLITRADYRFVSASFNDPIAPDVEEKREDTLHNINVNAMIPITSNLNAQANISYFTNSSNYDLAVYDKSSMTLGIEYNY